MNETIGERDGYRLSARFGRWFLLTGNRHLVALLVLLGIGTAFFVVGILGLATVTTASRVMWYLNGTINGLLTLVPISVGVNQIVLSHEFGSVEDLYERRTDTTEFRERVEDRTGTSVSSPHASTFFGTLLSSISSTASTLRDRGGRPRDRSPQDDQPTNDLGTIAGSIADQANRINDDLAANGTSMLRTFLIMLDYDDSAQLYEIRRLRSEMSDRDGETAEELQQIVDLFIEIDATRQFLKTVVVERQLAYLSRLLIYTGIPAVTVAVIGIFTYRDIAGLTVPHTLLVIIAGTIIVTTLVPLVILGAYILRVATIARQTAAYGPFIPEEDD